MEELRKAVYELTFILAPTISDDEKRELIEQMLSLIEKEDGEIMKVEKWGERDLAYTIKGFEMGYYVHVLYQADRELSRKVERQLRLKEEVLRYLTVRIKRKSLLAKVFSGEKGEGTT
jgi:small subunit ribosomal protein S6